MKLQNMKLARKWREYAGPKDERLEAENAKICKLGFMLLSFGMLMLLVLSNHGPAGSVGARWRRRSVSPLRKSR